MKTKNKKKREDELNRNSDLKITIFKDRLKLYKWG